MKSNSKFKLVLFDMAGTTITDNAEVPTAFTTTLESVGIALTQEELTLVRGASKKEALARILNARNKPSELLKPLYKTFLDHLVRLFKYNSVKEIDGTSATFHYLRAHDIAVALNTGFDRSIAELLISELMWDRNLFSAIVTGDDVEHGRPAPSMIQAAMMHSGVTDPQTVINVGDTVLDMQAGANARVGLNIAVLSGAHSKEMLAASPHDKQLASIADLPAFLRSLSF